MTIELRLGDCMEYMRSLPDKAFDLAIVDPPYGINVNHNMGRRAGAKPSNYKPAYWDNAPPPADYFAELQRVSTNQIIWGANHFIENFTFARNSSCWLMWDKGFSEDVSFAQFELAWTSFPKTCKKFDKAPNDAGRIHPTQKPVRLYDWLLRHYSAPGQKILDTHLGSGSSAIAAFYFGCDFVGCEIDPDYYKAACERFDAETKQHALELTA